MNSIRRPRRRPRRRSINWQLLGWLLVREAALRVLSPHAVGSTQERTMRAHVLSVPTDTLRRRVQRWLNFRTDRRTYR